MRHSLSVALVVMSAACAAPRGYPSLQPRAAEAIDPRFGPELNPTIVYRMDAAGWPAARAVLERSGRF